MNDKLMVTSCEIREVKEQAFSKLKHTSIGELNELDSLLSVVSFQFQSLMVQVTLFNVNNDVFQQYPIAIYGQTLSEQSRISAFNQTVLKAKILTQATLEPEPIYALGLPLHISDYGDVGVLTLILTTNIELSDQHIECLSLFSHAIEEILTTRLNRYRSDIISLSIAKIAEQKAITRHMLLLEEVAKVSGVGGWEYDYATQKLYITQRTREIHELPNDAQISLEDAFNFYAPEAQDDIRQAVEQAVNVTGIWFCELPFITAKGNRIWVRTSGKAVRENGAVVRLNGAFQDITAIREQEKQIKESEQLAKERSSELQTILANMSQGVAVFDKHSRLKYWNTPYVEILGHDAKQIHHGKLHLDLLKETVREQHAQHLDPQQLFDEMQDHFQRGEPLRTKRELLDNRIVTILYSPLPDQGWIITVEDITEREIATSKIAHAAHHDTLTGLANRTLFNESLEKIVLSEEHHQNKCDTVLMLLDLDKFKLINDTHGHLVGDKILKAVAQRLVHAVRCTDVVARLGGDEFAVILSGHDKIHEIAISTAKRIQQTICKPYRIDKLQLKIGISIGLSLVKESDESISDVINRADLALYAVKNSGRNHFLFYDETLERKTNPK